MLNTGDVLEKKYQIISLLGKGAWGNVYLAENLKIGNRWAIKEIDLSKDTRVNLLAEPEILKKLNHRSLPRIVDIVERDNLLYIVEDYFEGISLKELIKLKNYSNEESAVRWGIQLCEILLYLHNIKPNPIIYRDMKPGNIIIDNENNVKLIDFGIAREYKQGQESDSTFIGTRGYAAPEQFSLGSQSDERTDIYGLGATLYHVLTGVSPNEPPYYMVPVRQINRSLSKEIEQIIGRCVKEDPEKRYQTVNELLNELMVVRENQKGSMFNSLLKNLKGQITEKSQSKTKEKIIGTIVIAVGGTSRGVGSTYTSIAIASFLSKLKYQVAVIELNDNPCLYTLREDDSSSGILEVSFRNREVDYYGKNISIADVFRAGYNYVVLDLGQLIKFNKKGILEKNPYYVEMNRSNLPILVTGAALWQLKDLAPYIKEADTDDWSVVLKTPETAIFREVQRELRFRTYQLPWDPDPFKASEELNSALVEILKNVIPRDKVKKTSFSFWR